MKRKRKGQNKYNKQWIREHGIYLGRLNLGEADKMTGKRKS